MKKIEELTEAEAREILEFTFPNKKDYEKYFRGLSLKPVIDEEGRQQVTFGMRPIIGIQYHNGQDNCILHFDNTKVVLWLYKNGYDITDMLEMNSHFSEMETDFENFAFAIHWLREKRNHIDEDKKHLYTLEYVLEELKKYNEKYYYKDYE